MSKLWISSGAVLAFLSVAMGAFGAHALQKTMDEATLSIVKTAAQYQMYHSLALIGFGLWSVQLAATSPSSIPGWSFLTGTLIFSGSLYALAFTGIKILGAITPIGGVLMMIGWISWAFFSIRS